MLHRDTNCRIFPSPPLSQVGKIRATVVMRRIGIRGACSKLLSSLEAASTSASRRSAGWSTHDEDAPESARPAAAPRRKRLVDPLAEDDEALFTEGDDAPTPAAPRTPSRLVRDTSNDAQNEKVRRVASAALSRATRRSKTDDDDDEEDDEGRGASIVEEKGGHDGSLGEMSSLPLPPAPGRSEAETSEPLRESPEIAASDEAEQQREQLEFAAADSPYKTLPADQLVEAVCAYLRATENVRLVNPEDERQLFPVLLLRLDEVPIQLLLAVVASHWTRSTLVRYGIAFKDQVRDFIASKAAALRPEEILDAIVVMGISAGRRKRDLDFFQMLGTLFAEHINQFRDPHDLVKVLTAFNRAKIVPPDSFLAMIGRRFPILNKKMPMQPLAAFRAFVNLKRMGHEQLNPFRFLADRIMESIQENVKREMIAEKLRQQQIQHQADARSVQEEGGDDGVVQAAAKAKYVRLAGLKLSQVTKLLYILSLSGAPHQQYLRPLIKPLLAPALPHLPPPSLSRLLKAMARFNTNDRDLIVPCIKEVLDRSRAAEQRGEMIILQDLLELLNLLRSPEAPLLLALNTTGTNANVASHQSTAEAGSSLFKSLLELVAYVSEKDLRLRPADMLSITSSLVAIRDKAIAAADEAELLSPAPSGAEVEDQKTEASGTTKAASGDAAKPEDEIQVLLKRIISSFAKRMNELLDLGVLSLTHAEILEDICKVNKITDSAEVAELKASRRRINHEVGDDEYSAMIDIDVRETFHKMLLVNNWNTYGSFKPLPGILQVDFRQALTEVSAETVLSASHLFEQAFPGHMTLALQRAMSRAFLQKIGEEGEEVLSDDRLQIVLRPPVPLLFSKEALPRFANLLVATPLARVKKSTMVWQLVLEKATRLKLGKVEKIAVEHLEKLQQDAKAAR